MNLNIDIVIPVLNDLRILDCIRSIHTFDDIDGVNIIIMCGNSTEEFVERVKANLSGRDRIYNEPDTGLFDALNMGLEKCTAEIIGWLGADDIFQADFRASQVQTDFSSDADAVIYSTAYHSSGRITRVLDSKFSSNSFLKWGFHNPHFSTFLKRNLACSVKFSLNNKSRNQFSDIEYFLEILPSAKVKMVPIIGTYMAEGGAASGSLKAVYVNSKMRYRLFREKYGIVHGVVAVFVNLTWKIVEKIRRKLFKSYINS